MQRGKFLGYRCLALLVGMAIFALLSYGQVGRLGEISTASEEKIPSSIVQPVGVALEAVIDPETYVVGPSDQIAVNIWTSPPLSFMLTVTPEGTLIVPTIGELKVADLTLQQGKGKVLSEIRKKYISATATVTLIVPRHVVVTVTGNVLSPGSLVLSATDRVNTAIQEANKADPLLHAEAQTLRRSMSTRNIELRRKDGSLCHVDLARFFATKDDRFNPYVREGDVIFVPSTNLERNIIGVYGEVNSPGRFEYVEGDSLTDAIRIAYGFTRFAMPDSVELSELDSTARILSTRIIDVKGILGGRLANVSLHLGDRIVVKARPDLRRDYRATVTGEVLFPGTYPITKDKTRLSELIARAGGFTGYAMLRYAELVRHSVSPEDIQTEQLISQRGSVSPEDSAYYHFETSLRLRREVVNVDFERLFVQHDSTQDVPLLSDDVVVVPSNVRTVYVFGEVVSPGHIAFVPGEDVEYYVRKAGGLADEARSGDTKIVKAKTKQWLSPDKTTIEPGDYVWVPKEPYRPFVYYTGIARDMASFVGAFIGLAILIGTIRK